MNMANSSSINISFDDEHGIEAFKHYSRSATTAAAICAIIFSIVGILGKNTKKVDYSFHTYKYHFTELYKKDFLSQTNKQFLCK